MAIGDGALGGSRTGTGRKKRLGGLKPSQTNGTAGVDEKEEGVQNRGRIAGMGIVVSQVEVLL